MNTYKKNHNITLALTHLIRLWGLQWYEYIPPFSELRHFPEVLGGTIGTFIFYYYYPWLCPHCVCEPSAMETLYV